MTKHSEALVGQTIKIDTALGKLEDTSKEKRSDLKSRRIVYLAALGTMHV